jgi:CRP-like cAMP-binding protein
MNLVDFLKDLWKFTDTECNMILEKVSVEKYKKGEVILAPNKKSMKLYFIEKGMIRGFYYKDEKEITANFIDENLFAISLNAAYFDSVDPYGMMAVEACTLKVAYLPELNKLAAQIPKIKDLTISVLVQALKDVTERLYSLQLQTAEERYKFMMTNHPHILLTASLGDIASYLGITQQTLSVIRSKK